MTPPTPLNLNRLFQIALLVCFTCCCLLLVTALGAFLYQRYGDAPSRLAELEERTKRLETEKRWFTRSWHETIGTTDGRNAPQFHSVPPKLGSYKVVEAWLTDWSPRSELLKFEEFRIIPDGSGVIVLAKPRTNEMVKMEFWITAIYERTGPDNSRR